MRQLNTEMTRAAEAGDADRWTELNSAFHMAMYEVSGRPRLLRIIRDLWFGRPTFSPIKTREQLLRSAADHDAIVDALERCDSTRLADLVRNHIKAGGEHWRDLLTGRETTRGG
jgi:DNA-binding GntR family transcriptional regulator